MRTCLLSIIPNTVPESIHIPWRQFHRDEWAQRTVTFFVYFFRYKDDLGEMNDICLYVEIHIYVYTHIRVAARS